MPRVTIKTGFVGADGLEEVLTEYLCDSPDCPNIATDVLGPANEPAASAVVCREHAPRKQPYRASDKGSAD